MQMVGAADGMTSRARPHAHGRSRCGHHGNGFLALPSRRAYGRPAPSPCVPTRKRRKRRLPHKRRRTLATTPTQTSRARRPMSASGGGQSQARSLFAKLYAGGTIVGVQLLLSIVGLGVTIERFANLRRSRLVQNGLAQAAEQAHPAGPTAVRAALAKQPSVLAGRSRRCSSRRASLGAKRSPPPVPRAVRCCGDTSRRPTRSRSSPRSSRCSGCSGPCGA